MSNQKETAAVQTVSEKAILERKKIKLEQYHSTKYLKNKYKGKDVICILPNGKEIKIDG